MLPERITMIKPKLGKNILLISGILRDKTIDDKLTYFPNDDKQKYSFCRLNVLVECLDTNSFDPKIKNT